MSNDNGDEGLPSDLSGGELGRLTPYSEPKDDQPLEYKVLREKQGLWLRWLMAGVGVATSFQLLYLFSYFIFALIHSAKEMGHANKPVIFDWHVVFVGSLIIVPLTVILLTFSRAVFSEHGKSDEKASVNDLPVGRLIELMIDAAKDVFGKK